MALPAVGNGRIVVGNRLADRYELEELVGSGGMSSVYRAHDTLLERHVALKVLHSQYTDDDEYVERFRREARAAARLSHPNIVTVIDRGEANGRQFIVFEYVEGENLKELIDRTGPLPVRRALELGLEIARGLAFAHEHGLVHRDVKPQNVLLNGDGEAKVTDFGIARSLDVEHGMTITGTVLGTSNYIAPEQARGQHVDAHTDVYSLGVVLYELLTGHVPFAGDNFVAVAMRHINDPAPSVVDERPDVPPRLAASIARALEKDPGDRFSSMGAFAVELDACLHELDHPETQSTLIVPPPVRPEPPRPGGRRAPRRRWPIIVAIAGLLAATAFVVGVLTLGGSNGNSPSSSGGGGGGSRSSSVTLQSVKGYDPKGTGGEHDGDAPKAVDGDTTTYWQTEHYASQSFGGLKTGVGLLLSTGSPASPKQVTVTTDTPGFQARILAGDSPDGPFSTDSETKSVESTTTFALNGRKAGYYVLWITSLPSGGSAHVNEVRAR